MQKKLKYSFLIFCFLSSSLVLAAAEGAEDFLSYESYDSGEEADEEDNGGESLYAWLLQEMFFVERRGPMIMPPRLYFATEGEGSVSPDMRDIQRFFQLVHDGKIVELLSFSRIKRNFNFDVKDSNGWSALHWAAFLGHEAVIKFFLEGRISRDVMAPGGKLPYQTALEAGHLKCALLLGPEHIRSLRL